MHNSLPELLNVSKMYYQSCFQKCLDGVADFFSTVIVMRAVRLKNFRVTGLQSERFVYTMNYTVAEFYSF